MWCHVAAADATWSYMRSQRCSIGFKSVGREGQHQHHQCPHHLWNCWQTPATWDEALSCKRRNQGPTAPEYGLPMGLRSLFQGCFCIRQKGTLESFLNSAPESRHQAKVRWPLFLSVGNLKPFVKSSAACHPQNVNQLKVNMTDVHHQREQWHRAKQYTG